MYSKYIKRFLDFFLSLCALLVLSPFLVLFTLIGWVVMKGNPFFTQDRPGKDEKVFKLIKFRTMTCETDKKGELLPDEMRLTKYGKFIRSTSIDELPELINILKGDMSLVGPRPERTENVFQYTQMLPEFDLRHRVKAGLTGYAQIYGKYNTSPQNKLNMDLIYIEKYSLLLDIKLLIMTIKIIFMRESTEGFSDEDSIITAKTDDISTERLSSDNKTEE